ncbi:MULTISPECIES: sn-glycerol-3-phosphate ABC transporter ATP-binding protein UgpC [unclassified Clostridium]|uniref:ABC transporter ATP-binding protein n=1 Tax=unclassified Clostridium TaxID=2614128 RepID=UPI000297E713|nr:MULTISPECIES: sn-glycerol-3-phosphate ABC transporter ATP-binding protein UgpC [unclassified Clostridium]EKQ56474.1 MAG: ATPase component of ABC-type sugar transporter [Clostridium sp. Maddingley MBC34-26]
MAGISLKNIEKIYPGNVTVVKGLNLEINDGEFVVLVGPSGCGKSTTLRMIAGLEDISGGELYIGDRLVNEVSPKDRDISMVFQNYALYPHMTVYKNIGFGLNLRKFDKKLIDKRTREVAKILDIEHLLNRKPKELSGGQRQRVALGRAMVREPSVFLLDEPLSNLDAKLRAEMRGEITKLHRRLGITFVYVTHDQIEAMTMGDRIVVMKDGYIQQMDTPMALYETPCNQFVAGFIGSPQMNFIDSKIEKKDNKYYVNFNNYSILIPKFKGEKEIFESYVGKSVVLGIRPEHVYIEKEALENHKDSVITTKVVLNELMGAEVYLHVNCDDKKITLRASANTTLETGESIKVAIDEDKIHLFDKETGITICN